ncbi:MAG: CHASE2 domain-containing protein [Symploca sp. SIO2C1]|nr:CHASE2 domain-containing protein [Symploca sp. SIO2C1]
MAILVLVIIARLTGSLQLLEWVTLDYFLRLRPPEPRDERVLIVGIDEKDIQSVGTYPIPDREMAALLRTLQKYEPRAIGLDIVRDIPVEPGNSELVAAFKDIKNLIGAEKVLPVEIAPPPALPPQQVGFVDAILDKDGKHRRSLLGTFTPQGYKFSLSLRLAETYLAAEGYFLDNCIHEPHAMCFGSTELSRFGSNSGGYVRADDGGVQVLLNFRSGGEKFRTLSLRDIKKGDFNPDWIRDRIVIIGITAPSIKDIVRTSAVPHLDPPGQVYGVEIHANSTSQIISAVVDGRTCLKTWSDGWEYLWIFCWGFLAIGLGRFTQSPFKNLLYVAVASISLIGVGYIFLVGGWWIPVAPALLVVTLNAVGLSAFAFYQYDQALRAQIAVRQHAIEDTFNVIHNGPLQTLANVLRSLRDQNLCQEQLLSELENLNYEIRSVGEYLKQQALTSEGSLLLGNGVKVDLNLPIHELFYEVHSNTLERTFPCFTTLKVTTRSFEPIETRYLSIEQKRGLCQFLEEALCNVGKYAKGVTLLKVLGTEKQGWYILSIKDNGIGSCSSSEGRGTKQCRNVAKQLGGEFRRESLAKGGTLCEVTFPVASRN